jgi:hypothetical protein
MFLPVRKIETMRPVQVAVAEIVPALSLEKWRRVDAERGL